MIPIDEQYAFAHQFTHDKKHSEIAKAILASLQRLKKIDAVQVPEEPKMIRLLRTVLDQGEIAPLNRITIDYIDTLRDLLKRETARADSYVSGAELAAITILRERAEAAEAKLAATLKLGENPSEEMIAVGGEDLPCPSDAIHVFRAMFAKLVEEAAIKEQSHD